MRNSVLYAVFVVTLGANESLALGAKAHQYPTDGGAHRHPYPTTAKNAIPASAATATHQLRYVVSGIRSLEPRTGPH